MRQLLLSQREAAPSAGLAQPDGALARRMRLPGLMAVTMAAFAFSALTSMAEAGAPPGTFADLATRVTPAVVNISSTHTVTEGSGILPDMQFNFPPGSPFEEFFKKFREQQKGAGSGTKQKVTALGSGFIIDTAGYVVTNNHVIDQASDIQVTLTNGDQYPAKLVGTDAKTDLALLKINATKPLTAVTFGDSDVARVGDWVMAVGYPFGLGGSVSVGVVSARSRDIHSGPFDDFLQLDASINQGNSGGPTFNLQGQVVGVNTAIYSPNGGSVGIGFAIPANLAKSVVASLQSSGRVTRGWLGVEIQQITPEMANALGLDKDHGALVAGVQADSPASKAGVKIGDVITSYAGKPINSLTNLTSAVADSKIGSSQSVEVVRQGKPMTLSVTIAQLKDEQQANAGSNGAGKRGGAGEGTPANAETALGLTLMPLNQSARSKFDIPKDVKGVLVTGAGDGAAADLGVQPGDIIEQVNNRAVTQPRDVTAQVAEARKAGRKAVALLINRGGQEQFIAVPFDGNS